MRASRTLPSLLLLAAVLFSLIFGLRALDFWWSMAAASGSLALTAMCLATEVRRSVRDDVRNGIARKALIGVLSALLLYAVFFAGNIISHFVIPDAAAHVGNVYRFKEGQPLLKVILLIVLVIGPAEEIFWRGFVQNTLARFTPALGAVLLASLAYSLVHVVSGNPMLLIAAFVCGLFWGFLFTWQKSLLANCISHVVWDLTVFVLFPF